MGLGTGSVKLAFDSGHNSNVYQAKIVPETDEQSIVTCAADEQHLLGDENVGITGLAFSEHSELLVSYAEEFIYCFSKDMGWGNGVTTILADHLTVDSDVEMETGSKPGSQLFKGHRNCVAVKGVSLFGPKCEYVPSGSDCGRMFIWRKKDAKLVRLIEADKEVVNCIEAHPDIPILASSGIDNDIKIWTPTKASYLKYREATCHKMRRKTGSWMHRMLSPRDMTLQLPARLNQQTNPERVLLTSNSSTALRSYITPLHTSLVSPEVDSISNLVTDGATRTRLLNTPSPHTNLFFNPSMEVVVLQRHAREPVWHLDSGCLRSMTGVKQYLHKYVEEPGPKRHAREPVWHLDSGCLRSMTGVKQYLHKYVEEPGPKVVFGDNSSGPT
ncbi:WD40 repeat-containing protein [Artemisia annua]|uniref:WD40 repeat-containing protein n=1 Tax=Artemisia annua TaxID=35608 RepID=A0A2U1MSD3_ARTAN|nr:WD40 repeat-containing protein [Artemisia annua]